MLGKTILYDNYFGLYFIEWSLCHEKNGEKQEGIPCYK